MTWAAMSAREKETAAVAAVSRMSYREAAAELGTTAGSIAGVVGRVRKRGVRTTPRERRTPPRDRVPTSPLTREKVDEIAALVADSFHISAPRILAGDRATLASTARHVLVYLLLQMPRPAYVWTASGLQRTKPHDRGLAEVGRLMGFDHTTMWHSGRVVEDMRDDPLFDAEITRLEQVLGLA